MRHPKFQTPAEPRPDESAFRTPAQHALNDWLDSLTPSERAAVRDRRRRSDLTARLRLGILFDRRRS
jgi:hypothetical protein